ncbi:MAG TPA: SDR family oxidoreductase [Phycisphaerae bacterium]|nr:SDR family oxidoreductase [Phycisphaerae bacterium]HOJ73378.1 SDR family oxidoreductase [Phycisphaerae bacterium]HOM50987.1 SDR family oxidoreductase [Phycisphaerae bacterium]HON68356.1 SDR family oxidoreductase [Phycisphaerae bacterium]HOQ86412.1 SDR family oxidoreductase [Phycisphaerae bacterium]
MSSVEAPSFPPQQQQQPGKEHEMQPRPESKAEGYRPAGKLLGKAALISGGDSGIGRAVAVMFAKEGADVAVLYLNEHQDAEETRRLVEQENRRCLLIAGDVGDSAFCEQAVRQTVEAFGHLDILVNNAAEQHVQTRLEDITDEQLERTFRTNIFAYFYLARAALKYMREGATIINTTSVTAYEGNPKLIDYASTKGAIVAFTRSLALALAERNIRVNGVAPGPIWTPLIPATFPEEKVEQFGKNTPLGRAGQPDEVAPCYVFLASSDASYISGQVLHPNGGRVING